MIFPNFIKPGDTIGVTAPSDGNCKELDFVRLDHAGKKLGEYGFLVKETPNVRFSWKGRSGTGEERAQQLLELFRDDRVSLIVSAKGGDFLCEMLSCLDYQVIKKHPKWVQGYSDNTGLLFTMTTMCDIATVYGNHFKDFGMEPWHSSIKDNLSILSGNLVEQTSFALYENGFYDRETGLEAYVLTEPVKWVNANGEPRVELEGRLLGGCLDVLLNLAGTRFDHVEKFIEQYHRDGILWYLESYDLNSEELLRGLWQLKEAGWFRYAEGFVFGRPCMFESFTETSYREAVKNSIGDLGLPIILDGDIGHKGPQFTVVNGAMGKIICQDGKGRLKQTFQ